jgi:hypothetical protein
MLRMLSGLVAALALAAFVAGPSRAEDKGSTHEGDVVKAAAGKLTMTGTDKKEHTHDVAKDAVITIDGKSAKLEDLKPRAHVKVTTDDKDMVTKIEARSPAKR